MQAALLKVYVLKQVVQTLADKQLEQPVILQMMQFPFDKVYPVEQFPQTFNAEQELHPGRIARLHWMHLPLASEYPLRQEKQIFG